MPLLLNELLAPQFITKTISQVNKGRGHLSRLLKMDMNAGSAILKVPVRTFSYRINNHTREPAGVRMPGTGPATVPPNPIGQRQATCVRAHEKIPLMAEELGNISRIDGPNSQLDTGGAQYIAAQMEFMGEKFNSFNELLVAGFLRGEFFIQQSGDHWIPHLTNPGSGLVVTVDLGLPAANKTQLNMLAAGNIIDVSWDNYEAPIVTHCLKVRAAMAQLNGMPLACLAMNSVTFDQVINNTQVRTVGGIVQTPFESHTYKDSKDEGFPFAGMGVAALRSMPWLKIYIIDDVLSIGGSDPIYSTGTGTLTKVIPDGFVGFLSDPGDTSWKQMVHGSELVAEDYGMKWAPKTGFSAWKRVDIEPTQISLVGLLNAVPVAYRTTAWAYADVNY